MNTPNKLSQSSHSKLGSAHWILQQCVHGALKHMNIGVTYGHRPEPEQNELFAAGNSQLQYPDSKHNVYPSNAVDLVIYDKVFKYLWNPKPSSSAYASEYFYMQYARLDTLMQLEAAKLGRTLRWGGKWDNPHDLVDNEFIDVFHWELGEELCPSL